MLSVVGILVLLSSWVGLFPARPLPVLLRVVSVHALVAWEFKTIESIKACFHTVHVVLQAVSHNGSGISVEVFQYTSSGD